MKHHQNNIYFLTALLLLIPVVAGVGATRRVPTLQFGISPHHDDHGGTSIGNGGGVSSLPSDGSADLFPPADRSVTLRYPSFAMDASKVNHTLSEFLAVPGQPTVTAIFMETNKSTRWQLRPGLALRLLVGKSDSDFHFSFAPPTTTSEDLRPTLKEFHSVREVQSMRFGTDMMTDPICHPTSPSKCCAASATSYHVYDLIPNATVTSCLFSPPSALSTTPAGAPLTTPVGARYSLSGTLSVFSPTGGGNGGVVPPVVVDNHPIKVTPPGEGSSAHGPTVLQNVSASSQHSTNTTLKLQLSVEHREVNYSTVFRSPVLEQGGIQSTTRARMCRDEQWQLPLPSTSSSLHNRHVIYSAETAPTSFTAYPFFLAPSWLFGTQSRQVGYNSTGFKKDQQCTGLPLGFLSSFDGNNGDQFSVARQNGVDRQWSSHCSHVKYVNLSSTSAEPNVFKGEGFALSCEDIGDLTATATVTADSHRWLFTRVTPFVRVVKAIPRLSITAIFGSDRFPPKNHDELYSSDTTPSGATGTGSSSQKLEGRLDVTFHITALDELYDELPQLAQGLVYRLSEDQQTTASACAVGIRLARYLPGGATPVAVSRTEVIPLALVEAEGQVNSASEAGANVTLQQYAMTEVTLSFQSFTIPVGQLLAGTGTVDGDTPLPSLSSFATNASLAQEWRLELVDPSTLVGDAFAESYSSMCGFLLSPRTSYQQEDSAGDEQQQHQGSAPADPRRIAITEESVHHLQVDVAGTFPTTVLDEQLWSNPPLHPQFPAVPTHQQLPIAVGQYEVPVAPSGSNSNSGTEAIVYSTVYGSLTDLPLSSLVYSLRRVSAIGLTAKEECHDVSVALQPMDAIGSDNETEQGGGGPTADQTLVPTAVLTSPPWATWPTLAPLLSSPIPSTPEENTSDSDSSVHGGSEMTVTAGPDAQLQVDDLWNYTAPEGKEWVYAPNTTGSKLPPSAWDSPYFEVTVFGDATPAPPVPTFPRPTPIILRQRHWQTLYGSLFARAVIGLLFVLIASVVAVVLLGFCVLNHLANRRTTQLVEAEEKTSEEKERVPPSASSTTGTGAGAPSSTSKRQAKKESSRGWDERVASVLWNAFNLSSAASNAGGGRPLWARGPVNYGEYLEDGGAEQPTSGVPQLEWVDDGAQEADTSAFLQPHDASHHYQYQEPGPGPADNDYADEDDDGTQPTRFTQTTGMHSRNATPTWSSSDPPTATLHHSPAPSPVHSRVHSRSSFSTAECYSAVDVPPSGRTVPPAQTPGRAPSPVVVAAVPIPASPSRGPSESRAGTPVRYRQSVRAEEESISSQQVNVATPRRASPSPALPPRQPSPSFMPISSSPGGRGKDEADPHPHPQSSATYPVRRGDSATDLREATPQAVPLYSRSGADPHEVQYGAVTADAVAVPPAVPPAPAEGINNTVESINRTASTITSVSTGLSLDTSFNTASAGPNHRQARGGSRVSRPYAAGSHGTF